MVRDSGCRRASGCGREGSVTSTVSAANRSFRAASPRSVCRASMAEEMLSFKRLRSCPACFRTSGSMPPNARIIIDTRPFLPSASIRITSSASSEAALSIVVVISAASASRSCMVPLSVISIISPFHRTKKIRLPPGTSWMDRHPKRCSKQQPDRLFLQLRFSWPLPVNVQPAPQMLLAR